MTLTEFLLVRIAEDEAEARAWEASWGKCWECEGTGGYGVDEFDPPRVLAECEAKRRIVDLALNVIASFGDWDAPDAVRHGGVKAWDDVTRRERAHAHELLDLLVEPYADHPDFREEWRP